MSIDLILVQERGLEPPLRLRNWILSPARLPIPPLLHYIQHFVSDACPSHTTSLCAVGSGARSYLNKIKDLFGEVLRITSINFNKLNCHTSLGSTIPKIAKL